MLQVHILTREIMYWTSVMLKYLSFSTVDFIAVLLSKLVFGDLTKYGIRRPPEGPFYMKAKHNQYPILDLGTCSKIKKGEIQVYIYLYLRHVVSFVVRN